MGAGAWLTIVAAISYLLGSIPFSQIMAKMCGKDLRQEHSRNVGAMNVLRTTKNYPVFALALILDMAKGAAAIWVAQTLTPQVSMSAGCSGLLSECFLAVAAACVICGHNWPIWLKFHGGKGLASLIGVVAFLHLSVAAFAVLVVIGSIFATEAIMSLFRTKRATTESGKGGFERLKNVIGSQILGRVIGIVLATYAVYSLDTWLFWIVLSATIISLGKHTARFRRYMSDLKA